MSSPKRRDPAVHEGGPSEYATGPRYTRRLIDPARERSGTVPSPVRERSADEPPRWRIRAGACAALGRQPRRDLGTRARAPAARHRAVATDGTREHLAADGIEAGSVSDLTAVPPLVGGQVKTFHPAIYAGILARRNVPASSTQLAEHGIGLIDLVVVNVKPFAPQVGRGHIVPIDEAIEMIDVGGVALLRRRRAQLRGCRRGVRARTTTRRSSRSCGAWARSPPRPATAWPPRRSRSSRRTTRRSRRTSTTSAACASPQRLARRAGEAADLPYGENPHQRAAFYRETTHRTGAGGRDADRRARRPPSTTCSTSTPRIASRPTSRRPPSLHRQARRSRRASRPPTLVEALPARARHRPGRRVRRGSSASTGARRGDGARRSSSNAYEAVVAPGFSRGGAAASCAARPALRLLVRPGDAPRGACPTTASRTSTSSASRAACSSRRLDALEHRPRRSCTS